MPAAGMDIDPFVVIDLGARYALAPTASPYFATSVAAAGSEEDCAPAMEASATIGMAAANRSMEFLIIWSLGYEFEES
jgi:hypothetical protein